VGASLPASAAEPPNRNIDDDNDDDDDDVEQLAADNEDGRLDNGGAWGGRTTGENCAGAGAGGGAVEENNAADAAPPPANVWNDGGPAVEVKHVDTAEVAVESWVMPWMFCRCVRKKYLLQNSLRQISQYASGSMPIFWSSASFDGVRPTDSRDGNGSGPGSGSLSVPAPPKRGGKYMSGGCGVEDS